MLQKILASKLGIGLKKPVFHLSCAPELQEKLWLSYVLQRRDGLAPIYVRKTKSYSVRVYKFHCYVVKEYTGDIKKLCMEVDVLQQVQHESLLGYLFMADEGARFSLFMEWAGQGLRQLVVQQQQQQQQQLGEDVARHIAFQLTNSLLYLQQKGIIHRDIKPDNIGVQPDFTIKLFDWSEALLQSQLQALTDKQLAKVAGVAGTPHFMPPEMLLYLTNRSSSSKGSSNNVGISSTSSTSTSSRRHKSNVQLQQQQQQQPQHQHQEHEVCQGCAAARCSCWCEPHHQPAPAAAAAAAKEPTTQHQVGHMTPRPPAEEEETRPPACLSLRQLTSPKLDVWGLGTVVYLLLAGRDILQQDSSYELVDMAEIVNATRGVQLPAKAQASPAARDFLARCLERDPRQRATASELLQHPWLSGPKAAAAAAGAAAAAQPAAQQQTSAGNSTTTPAVSGGGGGSKQLLLVAPLSPVVAGCKEREQQYVIAAHRGTFPSSHRISGSLPGTPVSTGGATATLSEEASEFE